MQIEGYPHNLFLKTIVPPELFCVLCKNVLRDPVTCLTCKIWLCLSCTQNAFLKRSSFFFFNKIRYRCNFGDEKHSYSPINKFIKNKIEEYQIRCKYSGQGCLKVAKVGVIDKHEEACEFSKTKEKKQSSTGNQSQFNSSNCPTSIFKCSTCKKQMLMIEVMKIKFEIKIIYEF